jgi:AraC family transcriptional regulator
MNRRTANRIDEPRILEQPGLLIAGIARTHSGSNAGMSAQWGEFAPWLGRVPGQQGRVAYGILYNKTDSGVDYLTGVEVADFGVLPAELTRLHIAPQRYAVFRQEGHVASISDTWQAIWTDWFSGAGATAAGAPKLERYPESFDPTTGRGGFEIWIPLEAGWGG